MKKLFGNTKGLKKNQIRRLENLYRRRIPPEYLITPELTRELSLLSHEIRRQIGLLINRQGRIEFVIVGNHHEIILPETDDYRSAPDRLKGLRCVHTHLEKDSLSKDDLTDLALLRLDLMAVITMNKDGEPDLVHMGHILPEQVDGKPSVVLPPIRSNQLNIGCLDLISALESELAFSKKAFHSGTDRERALLVSVTQKSKHMAEESLEELENLATSGGIDVVGTILQQKRDSGSHAFIGTGKIKELTITALQKGSSLIIFDQELSPAQIRTITDKVDLKVIDRTQLILDIFAQRAQSREGKLQVELAQMNYILPRLVLKNTAMSRLTGGIGGRGPGETKLEINRRRVRERILQLEKSIEHVRRNRLQQKAMRNKKEVPILSIVGYTNSGKSTLLNTLTRSRVLSENRLFATLDPTSRRLKFPKDVEVIITDTVGFIKDLPNELKVAFRATLEELENANLLLHVIDISNPQFHNQMESVNGILADLNLNDIPVICLLNKMDRVSEEDLDKISARVNGIPISAKDESTLNPLIEEIRGFAIRVLDENTPNRKQTP
ncbi:MAG: GTPase HflX [Desulfobacteraceae bacterium]|nr:GTPase HflX [Desulfobacteraceae bacterium]